MAHCIEQPWDQVYSIEGTEWHRIANHVPAISKDTLKPLLFPIVQSPLFVNLDGKQVTMENHKVLVADYRGIRSDLPEGEELVPLHIPKSSYEVLDNELIWNTLEAGLKDCDAKITSAGTLEKGRKFFISADIGSSEMVINKDKFKFYLNMVSSHDGTISLYGYDSGTRIVCMNTLRSSMNAAGEVGFKVYHTKGANLAMKNLPDLINAILKGRANLKQVMEYLATHKCDNNDAIAMATGYFCMETGDTKLSTRSLNAAEEIANLFSRGMGNHGKTLYDLVNGATEYWTSGSGTGKGETADTKRVYRSSFGSAADHKEKFVSLLADESDRLKMKELGKEALVIASK
jgi:hypothetical protein